MSTIEAQIHRIIDIAAVCHEANKMFCEMNGDPTQATWFEAEEWQRNSAISGVGFALANPDATPEDQHNKWMQDKLKDGWVYGDIKDAEAKTHPCLVPYSKLPEFQRKKDKLFKAIVNALK